MKTGPLNESELEWLDDVLARYGNEHSVMDVSELDGMLTAILSSPVEIEPAEWMLAVWGGADNVPRWANDRERDRFVNLTLQHMDDIGERLGDYPDQYEPLFGTREAEGQEITIVEEWCFGYMRGVGLSDWSALPEDLQPQLDAIALHGSEENFERLDELSAEEFVASVDLLTPAAITLCHYWLDNPQVAPVKQPVKNESKIGRNDPCPCGSGKKYKSCCLK
ncbi:YecA family protein [Scandinavium sp. V105_16]|uniref:YecA family protein n=1 Tax=Scandinavium lactucae TaxID=3095028 RepID=A0AAJ2S3B6_9ENTR|nr:MULTISPECIES: YecA family protein [unclassified Scandinavium]MDX6019976.1 YecA family protein [Scandinavium sp. V105_16]MDX6031209.1 YecA family protein [Scandinavium sp. V105_12]MDX6040305.1 YecA family protein [Scandinavium sp. V105_6]MDX6051024.1 YecA family protein [Scandinavium sp. V105_1]